MTRSPIGNALNLENISIEEAAENTFKYFAFPDMLSFETANSASKNAPPPKTATKELLLMEEIMITAMLTISAAMIRETKEAKTFVYSLWQRDTAQI